MIQTTKSNNKIIKRINEFKYEYDSLCSFCLKKGNAAVENGFKDKQQSRLTTNLIMELKNIDDEVQWAMIINLDKLQISLTAFKKYCKKNKKHPQNRDALLDYFKEVMQS